MTAAVRLPAHAGTFYSADARDLAALVNAQLRAAAERAARPARRTGPPLAGIVPHAGLVYSGAIAALGWAAMARAEPATIVLAGTDHQGRASGIATWGQGAWRCPIGDVAVDDALSARIVALGPPFERNEAAHLGEHSLEVQLPYIVSATPGARIVPLAVSPYRRRDVAAAGARLGGLLAERRVAGERVILVASSDFAHYPAASIAEEVDRLLLEPILGLDPGRLAALEAEVLARQLPGLVCGLCGIEPVRLTLAAAREMGARSGLLLGAATSAEAADGRTDWTVGYAAVSFSASAPGE